VRLRALLHRLFCCALFFALRRGANRFAERCCHSLCRYCASQLLRTARAHRFTLRISARGKNKRINECSGQNNGMSHQSGGGDADIAAAFGLVY